MLHDKLGFLNLPEKNAEGVGPSPEEIESNTNATAPFTP